MSEKLQAVSASAPGFEGINKNASAVDLSQSWALIGDNCVLDNTGRIASRKGWLAVTASSDRKSVV